MKERRFHRVVREILGRIFVGPIHHLGAEFVFGLRWLLRSIDVLDQVTLCARHAVERWLAGEVPTAANETVPPTAQRRRPPNTGNAAALARLDEITRGGRR